MNFVQKIYYGWMSSWQCLCLIPYGTSTICRESQLGQTILIPIPYSLDWRNHLNFSWANNQRALRPQNFPQNEQPKKKTCSCHTSKGMIQPSRIRRPKLDKLLHYFKSKIWVLCEALIPQTPKSMSKPLNWEVAKSLSSPNQGK